MIRIKTITTVISVLILVCLSTFAYALEDEMIITVASDATGPPMEMLNSDNHPVGFDIDFMNAVAKEAGFKVLIENTAWNGILTGLAAEKYDAVISSITINDKHKKVVDFSEPYINSGQVLVVPATSTAKILADMKGKQVGAKTGTTGAYESKSAKDVTLKTYNELGPAFEDMLSGRIDGIVCDGSIAANYALKAEYKGKFKITEPFTEEKYGIAVKKGNKELVELINKGIQAVKAKGIDKELKAKWIQ